MKLGNCLAIVLVLFQVNAVAEADDTCNYSSLTGKEFQLREKSESLQKYGYQSWKKEPDLLGKQLFYEDYVGKKGKIQEKQIEARYGFPWYVAILETCEKIYTDAGTRSRPGSVADLENHTGIYFLDTLRQAESLSGKKIWVNMTGVLSDLELFTDDPNQKYPLAHLETLEITGLNTKQIGHGRGAGPLYLVVKKETGEKGYLAFNDLYFFLANPIDPKWDKATAEIIKQRKIKLGMSEQQLLLSWGKPERINKTVGSSGVHEQWVYGLGQYVYMQNGKLTSFQSSR